MSTRSRSTRAAAAAAAAGVGAAAPASASAPIPIPAKKKRASGKTGTKGTSPMDVDSEDAKENASTNGAANSKATSRKPTGTVIPATTTKKSRTRKANGAKESSTKPVDCICSRGDDGSPMILCSECQIWCVRFYFTTCILLKGDLIKSPLSYRYHFTCVDITEPDAEEISEFRYFLTPCPCLLSTLSNPHYPFPDVYICPTCTQTTGRRPASELIDHPFRSYVHVDACSTLSVVFFILNLSLWFWRKTMFSVPPLCYLGVYYGGDITVFALEDDAYTHRTMRPCAIDAMSNTLSKRFTIPESAYLSRACAVFVLERLNGSFIEMHVILKCAWCHTGVQTERRYLTEQRALFCRLWVEFVAGVHRCIVSRNFTHRQVSFSKTTY